MRACTADVERTSKKKFLVRSHILRQSDSTFWALLGRIGAGFSSSFMSTEVFVVLFLISLCAIAGMFWWKNDELRRDTQQRIKKALTKEKESSEEKNALRSTEQKKEPLDVEDEEQTETSEKTLSAAEKKQILRRAEVLLARERNKDAEKLFIRILSFEPEHQVALQRLAYLYLQTGSHAKSESLYRQLIDIASKNPAVHTNLGLTLFHQKKFDESLEAYTRAIELEPHRGARYANLGQVYFVTQDLESAIKCFRSAVQKEPRKIEFLYLLADACLEGKKFTEARKWYERILDLSPYDDEAKEEIRRLKKLGF